MPRRRKSTAFINKFGLFQFPEVLCSVCGLAVKYDKFSYLKGLIEVGYVYDSDKILDTIVVGDTEYNLYGLKHLDCSLNERRSSADSTQSN